MPIGSKVALGDYYLRLGLFKAAHATYSSARRDTPDDVVPLHRLLTLAVERGDLAIAKDLAGELAGADRSAIGRIVVAEAYLLCKEYSAAARVAQSAVASAALTSLWICRGRVIQAKVAKHQGDYSAAEAMARDGLGEYCAFATKAAMADVERSIDVFLSLCQLLDKESVTERVSELDGQKKGLLLGMWAFKVAGDLRLGERALADSDCGLSKVVLAEHRLSQRPRRDVLESIASDMLMLAENCQGKAAPLAATALLLAGSALEKLQRPEEAIPRLQEALAIRPTSVTAAVRLSLLALANREFEKAQRVVAASLRANPKNAEVWRVAARVAAVDPKGEGSYRLFFDSVVPGAGNAAVVAKRLTAAQTRLVRSDVLEGIHASGHRIKNQVGVIASRSRRLQKSKSLTEADALHVRELVEDTSSLFEDWGEYLKSVHVGPLKNGVISFDELLASIKEQMDTGGIVSMRVPDELPKVSGDSGMLRDAFSNLIGNAIEAASEAVSPLVTIEVNVSRRAGGAILSVKISDNGGGIAPGVLPFVFSPGFTTKDTGSGIGLAVADRVIQSHGGTISLASDPQGTEFEVVLPCKGQMMYRGVTFEEDGL